MLKIPGYELIQQIGSGGMASVWKARQLSLDRIVAIKILGKTSLPDQDALDRFKKEAHIAARLNHPAIVQVYDAGEVNGEAFLVMEYVDGHTVADEILQRNGLSEARALEIAATVAKALAYAWEKECLIHCDIKPDNILIDRNSGAIKVADLGLARMIGQFERRDDEHIIGTPNYIAPEQSAGIPDLDCRTDMYALGATLYHMVTGVLPFRDAKGSAAMSSHEEGFLDDPQKINPTMSSPSAWLIEKLMIKNRALRPHFWTQVLKDFDQIRQGQMPFDPLPEEGCSTVRRAATRTRTAAAKPAPGAAQPAAAPKLKIKRPDSSAIAKPAPKKEKRGKFVELLTSMLVIGVTGLAVMYYHGKLDLSKAPALESLLERARDLISPRQSADAPAEAGSDDEAVQNIADVVDEAISADPAAVWDSEDFQTGAKLLNEAKTLYNEYLKDRSNSGSLVTIESKSREAIELLEKCRGSAPSHVPVDTYVSESFRLISMVRKNMTPEQLSGQAGEETRPAAESRPKITVVSSVEKPSPPKVVFVDDEPAPAPASTAPVEPAKPPANLIDVALDPSWQTTSPDAAGLSSELRGLLSRFAPAATAARVDDSIVLYPGITAMMTAFEASRVLQMELPIKRGLSVPGFPANSFHLYEFEGNFSGARRLTLVVDRNNRVLMVQLVDDKALPARLEEALFSPRWRVVDLLRASPRTGGSDVIAHRARERDQLIRIDTEVAPATVEAGGTRTANYRAQLMIPVPLAGLIVQASR